MSASLWLRLAPPPNVLPRRVLPLVVRPLVLLPLAALLLAPAATSVRAQDKPSDFAASDADGSGGVDQQEYRRRMVDVFYFADRDKDGRVTLEELQVIETVDPNILRDADTDHDGAVELNEFIEYRMRDFNSADTDNNGTLSPAEVEHWNATHGATR